MFQGIPEKMKEIRLIRNEPDRDWAVLFGLLVALVLVSLGWSTLFFFRIMKDVEAAQTVQDKTESSPLSQTETELRKIIDSFEQKKAESERIRSGGASLGDPSVF